MGNEKQSSGSSSGKNFLWVVVALLLIVIVVYNLSSGLSVKKINISGIFEAEFAEKPASVATPDQIEKFGEDELKKRQAELEKKLTDLEAQLAANRKTPAGTTSGGLEEEIRDQMPLPSLAGAWRTAQGVSYYIQQNANAMTLQEVNPIYGVTAVGQGTIAGQNVQFNITTAVGTWGSAQLSLAADGRQLNGYYSDAVTGAAIPLALFR